MTAKLLEGEKAKTKEKEEEAREAMRGIKQELVPHHSPLFLPYHSPLLLLTQHSHTSHMHTHSHLQA